MLSVEELLKLTVQTSPKKIIIDPLGNLTPKKAIIIKKNLDIFEEKDIIFEEPEISEEEISEEKDIIFEEPEISEDDWINYGPGSPSFIKEHLKKDSNNSWGYTETKKVADPEMNTVINNLIGNISINPIFAELFPYANDEYGKVDNKYVSDIVKYGTVLISRANDDLHNMNPDKDRFIETDDITGTINIIKDMFGTDIAFDDSSCNFISYEFITKIIDYFIINYGIWPIDLPVKYLSEYKLMLNLGGLSPQAATLLSNFWPNLELTIFDPARYTTLFKSDDKFIKELVKDMTLFMSEPGALRIESGKLVKVHKSISGTEAKSFDSYLGFLQDIIRLTKDPKDYDFNITMISIIVQMNIATFFHDFMEVNQTDSKTHAIPTNKYDILSKPNEIGSIIKTRTLINQGASKLGEGILPKSMEKLDDYAKLGYFKSPESGKNHSLYDVPDFELCIDFYHYANIFEKYVDDNSDDEQVVYSRFANGPGWPYNIVGDSDKFVSASYDKNWLALRITEVLGKTLWSYQFLDLNKMYKFYESYYDARFKNLKKYDCLEWTKINGPKYKIYPPKPKNNNQTNDDQTDNIECNNPRYHNNNPRYYNNNGYNSKFYNNKSKKHNNKSRKINSYKDKDGTIVYQ
jgi:hypothetical protein